jgi:hypothetical protein
MRNPFHRHVGEAVETDLDLTGWSTKIQRRVPRDGHAPLYFQFRVPDGTSCIEVADLVAAARDAPSYIAGQAEKLSQAADRGGAVLIAALTPTPHPEDILATITVVFSPHRVTGPVPQSPEVPGTTVIEHTMTRLTERITLENYLYVIPSDVPDGARPVRLNQYFVDSHYGALVIAFMTAHEDSMLGDYGHGFFREVMKSVWIGETEAPDDM